MNNLLVKSVLFTSIIATILTTAACSQSEAVEIQSTLVSPEKIKKIIANVERLHPDIDAELKQQVAEIAVRSIENQIFVEGGSFDMGDFGMKCTTDINAPEWEKGSPCHMTMSLDEKPGHKVALNNYSMSKYETSVFEFEKFKLAHHEPLPEAELRKKRPDHKWFTPENATGTQSWQEAKDYCLWLAELTEENFDLPTEAQWEFVARNRGEHRYYATDDGTRKHGVNVANNSDIYPIDSFPPTPLGLYHLQGNVSEWVNDWFDPEYYKISSKIDPKGPKDGKQATLQISGETGIYKVIRGTVYDSRPYTTVRFQAPISLDSYYSHYGFRCAVQDTQPIN